MNVIRFAALIALGFALSGCATIINGTTQSLSVNTVPVDGAKCTLTSSEGTWFLTSPGTVVVHKTKNDLHITCTKGGFEDATTIVPPKFGGMTFANAIAGGLIGAGVDAASGANYEYPSPIMLMMKPMAPPAPVVQPLPDTSGNKPSS